MLPGRAERDTAAPRRHARGAALRPVTHRDRPGRGAAARGVRHNGEREAHRLAQDRKSTRLNSSHGYISYAVFCLKKKKKTLDDTNDYIANTLFFLTTKKADTVTLTNDATPS